LLGELFVRHRRDVIKTHLKDVEGRAEQCVDGALAPSVGQVHRESRHQVQLRRRPLVRFFNRILRPDSCCSCNMDVSRVTRGLCRLRLDFDRVLGMAPRSSRKPDPNIFLVRPLEFPEPRIRLAPMNPAVEELLASPALPEIVDQLQARLAWGLFAEKNRFASSRAMTMSPTSVSSARTRPA
jgi:hypothetical protein